MVNFHRDPSLPEIPYSLMQALTDPYYIQGLDDHFESLPEDFRKKYKDNNYSVTTLARPSRALALDKRHSHKVWLDPITSFKKMMGHVVHTILEKYPEPGCQIEKRMGVVVKLGIGQNRIEIYVHGQVDVYDPEKQEIRDWKFTSADSMIYGSKRDYHAQLNVLAYIWRKRGLPVSSIKNTYLFHDWKRNKVRFDKADHLYPHEAFKYSPVPMWADHEVEAYIMARVRSHRAAAKTSDEALEFCTSEELWKDADKFKIKKYDNKKSAYQTRAKVTLDSREEADAWVAKEENAYEKKKGKDGKVTAEPDKLRPIKYGIEVHLGRPKRCNFCDIAGFCNQYRQMSAQFAEPEEEEKEDE